MNNILLFNPRSARTKPRIPNSILSIAAAIEGVYEYAIVDGNLETDPWQKINSYLSTGEFGYFGCTCMPGPQLRQAIPISKQIRTLYPAVKIIWGGYFPSNQPKVVLQSGFVDLIVNGPGDKCFPALLQALNNVFFGELFWHSWLITGRRRNPAVRSGRPAQAAGKCQRY